jgi:TolA-binding protein
VKLSRQLLAASLFLLVGCTAAPNALLDRADRQIAQGDYIAAVRTYDELLARYPDDSAALRAWAGRDILGGLLAARDDVSRLRKELTAREAELGRIKQDLESQLSAREAELGRIKQDLESLREDLEQLKRIDLRQERRPR